MIFQPHKYQETAINWIYDHPKCGLFLDMGLGKTVTTLTAIEDLIYNRFEVRKALVIAPLRVAENTWGEECAKWGHISHLRISKVLGSVRERRRALAKDADIYIINRENVVWLCNELSGMGDMWFFDVVVIDELSSFKSARANRFKSLRKYITRSTRVIGLTGTPSPNGLIDLWSQIYLLDGGERLGKTITGFRERYFLPDKRNNTTIFSYKAKEESEGNIINRISDICISMKAEDYLDMPERVDNMQLVYFSPEEQALYSTFERNCYMEFLKGEITALSQASLVNKLLQFSNGAMYLPDGGYVDTNCRKIEKLEEIIEFSNGKPVLCFYSYRHDLERIMEKFPKAIKLQNSEDIERWNSGGIDLLLAHPVSAGHGLNLQSGGNIIVWFGLTWSLELYQQANARLHRQGQVHSVIIHHIINPATADTRVMDSLNGKKTVQDDLLDYLNAKYGGAKNGS